MLNMTLAQRGHKHYFVLLGGYTNGDQEFPSALWLGLLLAVLRRLCDAKNQKNCKVSTKCSSQAIPGMLEYFWASTPSSAQDLVRTLSMLKDHSW